MKRISLVLTDELADCADEARGDTPRNAAIEAWLRQVTAIRKARIKLGLTWQPRAPVGKPPAE